MANKVDHSIPAEGFVNLNGFRKFEEPGEVLEGEYIGYVEIVSRNDVGVEQKFKQFSMYSDEYGIVSFNGTAQMRAIAQLTPGVMLRIVYGGEEKIQGGRNLRHFHIQVRAAELKPMIQRMLTHGGIKPEVIAINAVDNDADPFADSGR